MNIRQAKLPFRDGTGEQCSGGSIQSFLRMPMLILIWYSVAVSRPTENSCGRISSGLLLQDILSSLPTALLCNFLSNLFTQNRSLHVARDGPTRRQE